MKAKRLTSLREFIPKGESNYCALSSENNEPPSDLERDLEGKSKTEL